MACYTTILTFIYKTAEGGTSAQLQSETKSCRNMMAAQYHRNNTKLAGVCVRVCVC